MLRYYLFIGILFCESRLHAQLLQSAMFDQYTTSNGLSDNNVRGIAEDSAGFLWIGTQWGLNRLDGDRFVQYHSTDDSVSLPSDDVYDMSWIDDHRLGVYGTGLHIVDTRTATHQNIFIPYHEKKYQFKFNMVMEVKGDKNGDLFLLTRSGFYHYNSSYQLVYRFDHYHGQDVAINHFVFGASIIEIDQNRLLIIARDGLHVYDKQKKLLRRTSTTEFPLLAEAMNYPDQPVKIFQLHPGEYFIFNAKPDSVLYIDLNRNIKTASNYPINNFSEINWRSKLVTVGDTLFYVTGQSSGVYTFQYDKKNGKIQFNPQKQLNEFSCSDISKDKTGRLLIATNKGVLRQRQHRLAVETTYLPETLQHQFGNLRLDDVCVSGDEVYAIARTAGLAVFDRKTLAYEKTISFAQHGEIANLLKAVTKINDEFLLLGGQGYPMLFNTRLQTATQIIPPKWNADNDWTSDLVNDGRGNIWISANNIYSWNISNRKFSIIPQLPELLSTPSSVNADNAGNIWFACHGIARYNTALGKYDLYIDSFPFMKISDKQAGSIQIDEKNQVWFASNNNGLILYNPGNKSFHQFTKKDGLPDNSVYATIIVKNKIWVACYSGLACIDINQLKVTGFGREDGFPASTMGLGSRFFYDSLYRQLYIGFKDAIVRFKPDEMLQKKSAPKAFIESIVFNGTDLHYLPTQPLTTSWEKRELMVTIGCINFFDGSKQRYAYRIADRDSMPWMDLDKQNTFTVARLSSGRHRLAIKVYSATNSWPEQIKELEITVTPPFWLRSWFISLAVAFLTWLIYYFIRWRTSSVRSEEMVKTEMEKLRADDYKAQFELEQISNYFSSSLVDKKNEEEVLWDVAANLIGRMNYEDCVIYRWNTDKTKMIQKAAYGPKGKPEVILKDAFEVAPGQGIVGEVIITKKPLLVNDTRQDKRYRVDDEFRSSELAVPIIHDDELLGVIDSENSQVGYFHERDIKILTTIATLIGNKLQQIESEQSLQSKKIELAGINEQLAEARLSALQAQMNPHFVFNALNSIKRMILDADNEKASRYLSKFALMIRMTLEHSKETFVTLQDNIQYLKAYLEMEKLRFDGSFTYNIIADESVDFSETMLPSMMIQPLVENAIWHGLMYSSNEKKLSISFRQEQQKVICIIEDNGIGIRQSEKLRQQHRPMHRSVGLGNLQNRIKIINEKYHTDCSLEIIDLAEHGSTTTGTRAVLSFNQINI